MSTTYECACIIVFRELVPQATCCAHAVRHVIVRLFSYHFVFDQFYSGQPQSRQPGALVTASEFDSPNVKLKFKRVLCIGEA